MRREDVVGLAAQQQVEGPAEDLAQGSAEGFVEVGGGPAAQREPAGRSSCGPPGACMTPSRLVKVATTILRMVVSCWREVSMSRGRTALPRADRPRRIFQTVGVRAAI
jgi:hypothetical protein